MTGDVGASGGSRVMEQAALVYAERGWAVFPLQPRSKEPFQGTHGCKDATTVSAQVLSQWRHRSDTNVGVATGALSGFVVVDVDGPEGEASLAALLSEYGETLPFTMQCRTGRGRHIYFKHPGIAIPNRSSKLGPKLDVRGDGGYVVAPPSIHPNGDVYRWVPAHGPGEAPLADVPRWLLRHIERKAVPVAHTTAAPSRTHFSRGSSPYAEAALSNECAAVRSTQEGERNTRLNIAAFSLGQLVGGGLLDEIRVRAALMDAGREAGLTVTECENTITSGLESGKHHPRTKPDGNAEHGVPPLEESWDPPRLLPVLLPVPTFPYSLLPDVLAAWVRDIAERLQCPPEYVAVGAIVMFASVVGRGCTIRPKMHDTWTVVPNLWGAAVGGPGSCKSPALNEVMRPLQDLEAEAAEDYDGREYDRKVVAAKRKALDVQIAARAAAGEPDADLRDEDAALRKQEAAAILRRRYVVNETTTERFGEILRDNPRGVMLYRDELTGFWQSLEKRGREGDRAFYLESWAGTQNFSHNTIGRGETHVQGLCVSILGTIQPGPLAAYVHQAAAGAAGADGFMQRHQLLVYPDLPSYEHVDRPPDQVAHERVRQAVARLAELEPAAVGATCEQGLLPYLHFAPDAQADFVDWLSKQECRLRDPNHGMSEALAAHLQKYRSMVPSLALIFHLVDGERGPVSRASTLRAITWAEFLEVHARRLYGCDAKAAHMLLERIQLGAVKNGFTARDVYRHQWHGLDRGPVDVALSVLVEHGYLRATTKGAVGRPTVVYAINPALIRAGSTS